MPLITDSRAQHSRGFTLVEIAVVILVVAILLLGVFRATSLLDTAKSNDVIAVAGDLSEAMRLFKERFKVLPGDAPQTVVDLIPNAVIAATVNSNGLVDLRDESDAAGRHLFAAGLVRIGPNGRVASRYGDAWIMSFGLAADAANSPCGVAVDSTAPIPVAQHVAVFRAVPAAMARDIDARLDDGQPNTGSIRASARTDAGFAGAPPYGPGSTATEGLLVGCLALPL